MTPLPPRLGRRRDRGAAALELALVLPALLLLLLGILTMGLYFYDSIALRQAAREGARQAVVQATASSCSSGATFGARVACTAKAAAGPTVAQPLVAVPAPVGGWTQGGTLVVCVMGVEPTFGLLPAPGGGVIRTKTTMAIETPTAPTSSVAYQDAAPAGTDWSWCS